MSDWCGNSRRHEQRSNAVGGPPAGYSYHLPQGTMGLVKRLREKQWDRWITRKPLDFDEPFAHPPGRLIFQNGDWLLSVPKNMIEMTPLPLLPPGHSPCPP